MQENQYKHRATQFLNNLLRVEITLPHGFGMAFNELVPGARTAFGADAVAVSLEDVFHSVASHRLDSEFFQLADNPCVTPRVVLRQLENQLFNLLGRARPANVLSCFRNFADASRIHRRIVDGWTIVASSLSADPSFLANLTKRFFSR